MKNYLLLLLLASSIFSYAQENEPMLTGNYEPTWESLRQYNEAPDWYKDAKFGIWAHWGPQCQPEQGDWYARFMYYSGTWQYNYHVSNYGDPAIFGFKDIINEWKADKWDPDSLVHLYKEAGAGYFFAMANHHDNLDMWDSKYQPWNTVDVGPKQNIIGGWSEAAKKYDLPFGVSVHASHAWTWLEPSQDYDGNLTEADGVGKWWEGLNPQDLYAQNHARSEGSTNSGTIHSQWNWGNGASIPDSAYLYKFYNRTLDLINKYNPDLLYFDDTGLPFEPISDVGLRIAAHMYNKSEADNGENRAVIFGKILTEEQKEAIVWDVERGIPDRPQKKYWQTCTCIGDWHYSRSVYNNNRYKSAATVVRMLVDIISKNGNLLLNIPIRGDGTIDEKELAVVQGIIVWMKVNKESIHGTRPWITFGEGPTAEAVNPLSAQGFNEGTNYTPKDVRYVCKLDTVYATIMGSPETDLVTLKSLSTASAQYLGKINKVELLGYGELNFTRDFDGLKVTLPATLPGTSDVATVFKIQFDSALYSYSNLTDLISDVEAAIDTASQNLGLNTGQYNKDSLQVLIEALQAAKDVPASSNDSTIRAEIISLQNAFYNFRVNGSANGGKLSFNSVQNITRAVLSEARNFSRSDMGIIGTGRWGLLAEPWIYTNNIVNQESNSRGGFDNYSSSQSIGIQKWYSTDAAIIDGMIYQTTTLPAGSYKLKIKVNEQYGLQAGEVYLNVMAGDILSKTSEVTSNALAYYDISNASTGSEYTVCDFLLETETTVSIGWTTTIDAAAASRSMRINEILLLDGEGTDISADYLGNYTNIQRKDMSYPRFGIPTNWIVENFNIPQSNSDGTKKGIDTYSGFRSLMMGVWYDGENAIGDLANVKIYKKVTLPAGQYAFLAGYNALYNLSNMNLFVSKTVPALSSLHETALSYYSINGDSNDGEKYGLTFSLDKETTLYLGWIGDLTENSTQEFRASEISLLRILSEGSEYLPEMAFDASRADTTYSINMCQFDSLNNLSWHASADNLGFIEGNSNGRIVVGDINFGDKNLIKKVSVKTAFNGTLPMDATYDFYLDNEIVPFASIPAKNTTNSLLFENSDYVPDPIEISGIHKISIKYNNHASNIVSIGFEHSKSQDCKGVWGGHAFIDSCGNCIDTLAGEKPCITFIEEVFPDGAIISPNPFTNELTVKVNSSTNYSINNLSGICVESGVCNQICNMGEGLEPGIYILTTGITDKRNFKIVKRSH